MALGFETLNLNVWRIEIMRAGHPTLEIRPDFRSKFLRRPEQISCAKMTRAHTDNEPKQAS